MPSIATGQIQGFDWYGLVSEGLEVRVVPALGAKIISLKNRRSGREWLWRPPGDPRLFSSPTGTAFAAGTKWGLDECLPTIAACTWRGRALPDHGEAWTEAWSLRRPGLEEGSLTTALRLPFSPLAIERRLSLAGTRLTLAYALENLGGEPCEYLWALHPLLGLEPDDRLHLPPEVRTATTCLAINCPLGSCGAEWRWPDPAPGIDLARFDLASGGAAVKFFTPRLAEGWAKVENDRTGEFLSFAFEPAQLDTLGIWINRGGWAGYHHLAIEPTCGAPDALDTAVRSWRRFAVLEPGETRRWAVVIEAGNHAGPGRPA